jgi:cysteine synthase B
MTRHALLQAWNDPHSLLTAVGHTPLLRLPSPRPTVPVYAKAEFFNPSGSIKARAAANMLRVGIESGDLTPDKTLIDATSGNTGIALATFAAALGLSVTLGMPRSASHQRQTILRGLGASLILTDPSEGMAGAVAAVQERLAAEPDRYFYPHQYANEANWQAHSQGTGPEIWEQTRGQVTHFVSVVGTSGTFVGTVRFLRTQWPTRAILVQPDEPMHGLEGVNHLESVVHIPEIYDPTLADETVVVRSDDAYDTAHRLARETGLFVGASSGANVCAAWRVAEGLEEGLVVTILCDSGERYLGQPLWEGV